jgi:hypothetical protein
MEIAENRAVVMGNYSGKPGNRGSSRELGPELNFSSGNEPSHFIKRTFCESI